MKQLAKHTLACLLGLQIAALGLPAWGQSGIPLADAPLFSTVSIPGNLALALSVEYPTAISVANLGDYADAKEYLGYFDPKKCYDYQYNSTTPASSYFQPSALATGTNSHSCSGKWSGNFMNWATMQTIDPFRWALTGGYRSEDLSNSTILEKAWGAQQGSQTNFPLRGTNQAAGSGNNLPSSLIGSVTPFPTSGTNQWTKFNTSIWSRGNLMAFTSTAALAYNTAATNLSVTPSSAAPGSVYQVYVRVKVCDASNGTALLESNCVKYGSNYKPEGLMQQYANKIRYSTFSYLTQGGNVRQGGVLRSKMGFIGPTYPVPMSTTPATNTLAEWDSTTGVMKTNPDSTLASASNVTQSGSLNYINKFGQANKSYMTYDNVSELYYAVMRYFQNLGNVPEWTNNAASPTNYLDGFPAATTWPDPIAYSCQKNFVLGIGDNNTHYDRNTGGGTLAPSPTSRSKPALVSSDTLNKSADWTNLVEIAEGLTARAGTGPDQGSEYMAGLAYGNHVLDMRSDLDGMQTVSTYWMDVMEYQYALDRNPYWLAAKYGGFRIPTTFGANQTTRTLPTPNLTDSWWTTGEVINMNGTSEKRPDNYFLAGNAGQMVTGLTKAFNDIAASVNAYTTAVTPSSNIVASSTAYAASYGSEYWSGSVQASTLTLNSNSATQTALWNTDTVLANQFAGSGWNTGRIVVTSKKNASNGTYTGLPFRIATGALTTTDAAALDTSYVTGDDRQNYLNYLRGDKTNEANSTATGSTKAYRIRTSPLGDIVNSKLTLSPAPRMRYNDAANPGYSAFKTSYQSRTPLLLFGGNDGMMHALNASATGANAGKEVFAYIPAQTFYGPDGSTTADANSKGLAAIGNPGYQHRYYVDATPQTFDVDFNKVYGGVGSPDWRTIAVGSMGKGGKGFYAIDITDPSTMTSEASVAGKVLWEINNQTPGFENLGYSYGLPILVKTAKYGWTLFLTSGYNNSDGNGYIYLVNPKTGALLSTISTASVVTTASAANQVGLAQISAFINDYTDGTADTLYAGDLGGRLWRVDLRDASGNYPAPKILFQTGSPSGGAEPITSAPIAEIHPNTRNRMVLFGTGKLLDGQDITLTQQQSFYAIADGDNAKFDDTITSTLRRADLTQVVSLTTAVSIPTTSHGWYYDLGTTNNIAWRIVLTPAAADGVALFTATLTSGDACNPSGRGRAYAVDFARGYSVLVSPSNTSGVMEYADLPSSPTDNWLVKTTELQGIAGDDKGNITQLKLNSPSSGAVKLINWRELVPVN